MRIGYARVSTVDQNLQLQIDALKDTGCERVYTEHASGVSRIRPECQGRREIRPLWRSKNRPVWRRSSGFRGTAGTEPEGALQGDLRRSGRRPTKTGASGGWVSRKSEIVSFDFV